MSVYLDFFKLNEPPFSTEGDARFFYETPMHAEALANMLYTIQQRMGMVMITGEIGSGKTFLSSMLASRLNGTTHVAAVRHPPDSGKQLLRAVMQALDGKATQEDDHQTLASQLERHLERLGRRKTVAVVFDEAQELADDALEEIRLLWNWEAQGRRLLQIILVGQPQLRERLMEERWEAMLQRVALSYHLGRLEQVDTAKYILHRRQIAAKANSPLRFTVHALESIHKATRGVPRIINILCDNCLLSAYAQGTPKISSGIVAKVLKDMTFWYQGQLPASEDASESK